MKKLKIKPWLSRLAMLILLLTGTLAVHAAMPKTNANAKSNEKNSVVPLSKSTFLTTIWNYEKHKEFKYLNDKPVVIDFFASWCGPCKKAAPVLKQVCEKYHKQIECFSVNVEQEGELARVFQAASIPTFVYISKDGTQRYKTMGVGRTEAEINQMFEAQIAQILTK